ncbi:hypothetical protein TWF569_007023 [Orbilia oligospora]|uniref:Uncharacterized protein n=1 Tax=Orbilia oligospora TaxID=2813651 RepID=A0A7C8N836_ORBOL|nr:hypothetical protein TWF102_001171 [Orbilia oligospora]KAF3084385.1 hypothetical protein TWF706_000781 [Orbilia oligospora]KAF3108514.1 hypothetical protein TWF103_005591 [Orbilia oligospora]KAF3144836.1 hypothetical protein TWF569_007023 [Orbilia oligospora]
MLNPPDSSAFAHVKLVRVSGAEAVNPARCIDAAQTTLTFGVDVGLASTASLPPTKLLTLDHAMGGTYLPRHCTNPKMIMFLLIGQGSPQLIATICSFSNADT